MNIQVIGEFRFAIEDAINLLVDLWKDKPLPPMEILDSIATRLKGISIYDVVQSIVDDNDYLLHKEVYKKAFGGVLNCDVHVGTIIDNGNTFDYWHGMTKKLEESSINNADEYIVKVEEIRGLVGTLTDAIKKDLETIDLYIPKKEQTQNHKENSHDEENDGISRSEDIRCVFCSDKDCEDFFRVEKDHTPAWWADRTKEFIDSDKIDIKQRFNQKYGVITVIEQGYKKKIWNQIVKEHPKIKETHKKEGYQTFTRTLSNKGIITRPPQQEK